MAASQEFSKEQLNYYRICYVTTDILTEGLRSLFKQEWDNRYKATLGEWKDDPKSGMDFYNSESPRNQRRNAHLLVTIQNGDRAKWDCTMLFYAILYSDCIGSGLSPTVKTNLDDLRKFRNEEFAHMPLGSLADADFQNTISKVHGAFQALGLSTSRIDDVKNQRYFPTEELSLVLKEVDDLQQELRQEIQQRKVLEDQLEKEISPFCILPPKPSHYVTGRNREVVEITKKLKELKDADKNELSYLYISGNPGSGKSQLAGFVAKRFFDEARDIPSSTPCVMTLNAASPDSLLESYALMARQVKCPEYAVTNTINSKDVKTEEKISNLKTLISTRIGLYTSWLLIVDNVFSMTWVHVHLPERGNERWSNGQILVTTQDVSSIPSTSSFVNHVSISRGMEADESYSLLAMLSGISDSEMVKEVTMKLDYQPLALASAATYVKQVRQNKATANFNWADYLEKIEKGQRSTTEKFLSQSNLCYPKSMTTATTLVVENTMISDEIVGHTFALLSLCSTDPLSLDIVINYISRVDEQAADKEFICVNLKRCSLVLFEEDESGAFIRIHQVVHDAIKTVMKDHQETRQSNQIINAAAASFSQFITAIPEHIKTYSDTIHLVPHLKALIVIIESLFQKENTTHDNDKTERPENINSDYLIQFGKICTDHCEFQISRKYHEYALTTRLKIFGPDDTNVANVYVYLGEIHRRLDDLERAKDYLYHALEIYLKTHGPDNISTARAYGYLGYIHDQLGDLALAKKYHERALAINLKILGPDNVDVGTNHHHLGFIHHYLGDLERAKEYQDLALAIYLKTFGHENSYVTATYRALGSVHQDLSDLERAKEYYDLALASDLKILGPDHDYTADSYYSLGSLHMSLGDLGRAKKYYDSALAITLKNLGPDHTDVASINSCLGQLHQRLGDLERAKDYQDRALTIYLRTHGPHHTSTAGVYYCLGSIHQDLGDLERAKEYCDSALAIKLKNLGPDHAEVASINSCLGDIHQRLGDLELAKDYQNRALTIYLSTHGPNHTSTAGVYYCLGSIHQDLGDLERAKEYCDSALAIKLKYLGPDHAEVASINSSLGDIHQSLGDLERAKDYQDRALTIYLRTHGPEHMYTARVYGFLGSIHQDLGDLERAKEYHESAIAVNLKMLGHDHADVATYYQHLGCIHNDLGDLERAKEYQELAVTIYLKKLGHDAKFAKYVAASYHNLGSIHQDLGDLERAKEYQDRALVFNVKNPGRGHTSVATYSNMGSIHQELGDLDRAIGHQEPLNVTTTDEHIGHALEQVEDLEKSSKHQERSEPVHFQNQGFQHSDVTTDRDKLCTMCSII